MRRLLNALSWKQALSILIAAGAVVAGLAAFSRWTQERDFRPLYSALSAEDAALVLAKVKESGSEFRLTDNGTVVLAPSGRVA
jgi:flagellar M-ring protein FliF